MQVMVHAGGERPPFDLEHYADFFKQLGAVCVMPWHGSGRSFSSDYVVRQEESMVYLRFDYGFTFGTDAVVTHVAVSLHGEDTEAVQSLKRRIEMHEGLGTVVGHALGQLRSSPGGVEGIAEGREKGEPPSTPS